ncbi:uncharacterized protein IWZ02DRAFT_316937 [Phyllosticta citriasiana]|uniref:uncharacterized protein n=1 Tax=Phyllosticta citriasiana TaxID=595635 RepID=UPI0030FDA773
MPVTLPPLFSLLFFSFLLLPSGLGFHKITRLHCPWLAPRSPLTHSSPQIRRRQSHRRHPSNSRHLACSGVGVTCSNAAAGPQGSARRGFHAQPILSLRGSLWPG